MRKHNFLQNIVNSLRNDFDKVLESFQGIRAHDDFIATLAAPSEVQTCATGDLTEWFNNYWKARRGQSESGWINDRLDKLQECHLNGNNKRQGCNPKSGNLGLRNGCEKGSLIIRRVVINIHARRVPLSPLWRQVSFTDRIRTFPVSVLHLPLVLPGFQTSQRSLQSSRASPDSGG